jgi:hypothetical protein
VLGPSSHCYHSMCVLFKMSELLTFRAQRCCVGRVYCSLVSEVNLSFIYLLLCWVGVRCGIYKCYSLSNVSYSNSLPLPFFFLPSSPIPGNSFNSFHFSIFMHVYTVFAPYLPSFSISPPPLPSHWYQLLQARLFCAPIL